jgi:hypothetical protein
MADKAGDEEEEEGESSGVADDGVDGVVIILADMEDVRGATKGSSQRW